MLVINENLRAPEAKPMTTLSRRWQIIGGIVILFLIPLGFWLDVMLLNFYSWMGWT